MTNDELLDKTQARIALGGIGTTKLYQMLGQRQLEGVKIGKRLFFRRSEINRYIASLPTFKTVAEA